MPASLAILTVAMIMFHWTFDVSIPGRHRLHSACVENAPRSDHRDVYTALLCGERFANRETKMELGRTSLLHLLVLSGIHLLIVEEALRRALPSARFSEVWIATLLFLIAMIAGFRPPLVRMIAVRSATYANRYFSLSWTAAQRLTIGGFFALAFCENRAAINGLCLSWIAGIAVLIARTDRDADHLVATRFAAGTNDENALSWLKRSIRFHATLYLVLIPALLPLSLPHPIGILWNCLVSGWLLSLLLPIAIVGYLGQGGLATAFCDRALDLAMKALQTLSSWTPDGLTRAGGPTPWIWLFTWFYLWALTVGCLYFDSRKRHRRLETVT